jgi:hypothetical protein
MSRIPKDTMHLDDRLQEIWIDKIVLEALYSCGAGLALLARHLKSFRVVNSQARANEEGRPTGIAYPADIAYTIPKRFLRAFWD